MKKERPIIFSSEMVRAILAGRKTQTRRLIKPQPDKETNKIRIWWKGDWDTTGGPRAGVMTHGKRGNGEPTWILEEIAEHCPYGLVGDLLWVRETHDIGYNLSEDKCGRRMFAVNYKADDAWENRQLTESEYSLWLKRKRRFGPGPPRFMYKSFARIWLEITGIRVERVQEITEEDAKAEGVKFLKIECWQESTKRFLNESEMSSIEKYHYLWDKLNAKRGFSWKSNPWVWVIGFKRISHEDAKSQRRK